MNNIKNLKKIKNLSDLKILKVLFPFIKPYLHYLMLCVLFIFLITALDLLIPYLTKKAIDGFILSEVKGTTLLLGIKINSFFNLSLVFLGVILLIFIFDFFQSLFMEFTSQKIIYNLRKGLFFHMTHLPVSFYDKNSAGRLVSRAAGDIDNMNEMFSSILVFIFKDLVLMISIVVIMFFYDFKFAALVVSVIPCVIALVLFFSKISRKAFAVMREKIAGINHSFSENISGIKIIHTNNCFEYFYKKFQKLNYDNFRAGMTQIKIFGIFMPLIELFNIFSLTIILVYGASRINEEQITVGVLVAFISYMKMFFRPVRDLSEKFNLIQNALASAEKIAGILNEAKEKDSKDAKDFNEEIKEIEFKNVSFSYKKGEKVLNGISFKIKKGESLGIAGHTGAGKSSIINLITGFYEPDSGEILINGKNIKIYKKHEIRKKLALVMQDPVVFSGTLADNLMPENKNVNKNFLDNCLLNANCMFAFKNNNGALMKIREGGRPLSSGEKQLLCIARAFAVSPELIIFDEATSYIDSGSEKMVHDAMKKLMEKRTSIMIAHRLSTIKHANNIIVIKNSKITESGNHSELIRKKGDYYRLVLSG
ncbi:MAG: ABC transporter ATP-binding protein [Desulfobacteraceae bacterium]|nr:ABC transporter ATP-binding protein [Desulfobacteraceae bacterium]MCB9495194.1 ABC transporter ATP-binding protein [Desulfobacteraceae bacterium]